MDQEILFRERQHFSQWWIWTILVGINAFLVYAVYVQVFLGEPFGTNPESDTGLVVIFVINLLLTLFLLNIRLTTIIKQDGIHVRFFPFHLSFRHYPWDMIGKSYVRKYSPVGEYGGWGYRLGLFGKGKAYNISGNKGLQLEFTNKKRLLIGTRKPDELTAALIKIGKFNP
jgi:hypothetical protein